jgi:hypothetical protein|tara:strand:- start:719 stop:862 length:144 start_codon:yes stop_codon:yes gene_type:complete
LKSLAAKARMHRRPQPCRFSTWGAPVTLLRERRFVVRSSSIAWSRTK